MSLGGGPAVLIPFVRLLAAVVAPASGGAAVTGGREVTPRWLGTKWMSFAASLLSPAAPRQRFCSPAFIRCPSPKATLWLTLSAPQQSDSGFHINLLNPPDLLLSFFCLQTFAALPCINGSIFHHQKASGAEANGINSSAACQEHMPASEHREEGQCDTGTRWDQSASIPFASSILGRLVPPGPAGALRILTLCCLL